MTSLSNHLKSKLQIAFIFCLMICTCWPTHAQSNDFMQRTYVGLEGEFSNKISWEAEIQQQLNANMSRFDRFHIQPSLAYSPFDWLKVNIGYRIYYVHRVSENNDLKHRFFSDLIFKHQIQRVKLKYRTRLQYGFDDVYTTTISSSNALIQRHLLGLKYDIFGSRWEPYGTFEIYHHLNREKSSMLNRLKLVFGSNYLLSKKSTLDVSYSIRPELNVANPATDYILTVGYTYQF